MSKLVVSITLLATVAAVAFGALHGTSSSNAADLLRAIPAAVSSDLAVLGNGLSPADVQGGHFGCKDKSQAVGPCNVQYHVCAKLHHVIHLVYTASACVSGVCGSSSRHKSATGAAYEATYNLFLQRPSCACKGSTLPLGNCTFGVSGCFEFASPAAVESKQITFFANVSDTKTGVWADYCCSANATDSVKAAFTALSQKESLLHCY